MSIPKLGQPHRTLRDQVRDLRLALLALAVVTVAAVGAVATNVPG